MDTTPSSKALFPKLMAVMDTLETAERPSSERKALLAAAGALCEDQGLTCSAESISQAVDRVLAPPVEAPSSVPFDFGWRRPASREALALIHQRQDSWPRRLLRLGAKAKHVVAGYLWLDVFVMMVGACSVLTLLFELLALIVADPIDHKLDRLGTVVFSLAGLLFSWIWVRDADTIQATERLGDVPEDELDRWRANRKVREYVRHALEATGLLLEGDRAAIDKILEAHAETTKAQAIEQRHREMARW